MGALIRVLRALVSIAPWWIYIPLFIALFFLNKICLRITAGVVGLYVLPNNLSKLRCLGVWAISWRREYLSPTTLGTIFLHWEVYSWPAWCRYVFWLAFTPIGYLYVWRRTSFEHLYCNGLVRIRWGWLERLFLRSIILPWELTTRMRLNNMISWLMRQSYEDSTGQEALFWISNRVAEERLKATAYQLDCYIRADNLKEHPRFDAPIKDPEDLAFLCSQLDESKRFQFHRTLVYSVLYPNRISIRKPDATELLAHLSGLQSVQLGCKDPMTGLNLSAEERKSLGVEFLDLCQYSKGEHMPEFRSYAHALGVGLTGLANLARGDKDMGSFLKTKRIVATISSVTDHWPKRLSVGLFFEASLQLVHGQKHFQHLDLGYDALSLSKPRQEHRASKAKSSSFKPSIPQEQKLPSTDSLPILPGSSLKMKIAFLWYLIRYFLEPEGMTQDLSENFVFGVLFGLLTAGVRLISNLSTVVENQKWLLNQGALQLVGQILDILPGTRVRSAHEEAALFVYRIFENPKTRALIASSRQRKSAAQRIILKLRAMDPDLFGHGWGLRIGPALCKNLLHMENSESSEGTSEDSDDEDDPEAGSSKDSESSTEAVGCLPIGEFGETKTRQRGTRGRKPLKKCSREGCTVERAPGVKLKVCARCKETLYCSKECQVLDFPEHKLSCKPIGD